MSDRHLLYLIGQPGAGKSTLAAALTHGCVGVQEEKPLAHVVWARTYGSQRRVIELGARRDKFSGTDALSMSVQPKVIEFLSDPGIRLVLGEGDRLANGKFFEYAEALGFEVTLAYLAVSASVADARRRQRVADLGGKPQNPAWVAGRITKSRRLAQRWAPLIVELDADQPTDRVLAQLETIGHPVVAALRSLP
jgi:hypothetical protein